MIWNCALSEFLSPNVLAPTRTGAEGTIEADVWERDRHVDMTVTITGLWSDSTIVDTRRVDHLGCIRKGECRQRCDFIIFTTTNSESAVILVELKKTVGSDTKPYDQLLRSRPIAEYLISMAEADGNSVGSVRFHHVVMGTKVSDRFDKQRVRSGPPAPAWEETFRGTRMVVFLDRRIRAVDLLR